MTRLEVVSPGPLALVQDDGRPGWAALGVGPSGSFDRASFGLANRLVGNRGTAPAIEALSGGFAVRAVSPCVVAVTGADGNVTIGRDGHAALAARNSPLHLRTGDVLVLGMPTSGLRSYIAVRGGLRAGLALGSSSRDTLAALGPEPLVAGDQLAIGPHALGHPHVDHAPVRPSKSALRVARGPRDDWFTPEAWQALMSTSWAVSRHSDRVGVRLDGPALARRTPGRELASEPVVTGAVQVPPDGRPVVLGPDRPTTGGYPVIGVVLDADLDRMAQLRPGDLITFQEADFR